VGFFQLIFYLFWFTIFPLSLQCFNWPFTFSLWCYLFQFTMSLLWEDVSRQASVKGTHAQEVTQENQLIKRSLRQVLYY